MSDIAIISALTVSAATSLRLKGGTGASVQHKREPQVKPMKYRHVVGAAEARRKAFQNDSLMAYFLAADTAPFKNLRFVLSRAIVYARAINQKRIFTIREGISVVKYAPGNNEGAGVVDFLLGIIALLDTAELAKRKQEFSGKIRMLVKDAFGDRIKDMYELQSLSTHPDAQGRGYGSTLVKHILAKSDADGRDVWLVTVHAHTFYEAFGFTVAGTDVVGADNPLWDGKPISMYIMHRAAKGVS